MLPTANASLSNTLHLPHRVQGIETEAVLLMHQMMDYKIK